MAALSLVPAACALARDFAGATTLAAAAFRAAITDVPSRRFALECSLQPLEIQVGEFGVEHRRLTLEIPDDSRDDSIHAASLVH